MLCYNTYSGYTADDGEYWRVYVHWGTLTNRFTYRDVLHEDIIMKSSELSFWSSRWDEFFFYIHNDICIHMYEVSSGISGMRYEICGNQIGMYISDRMWIKSKIFILISINVVLNEMQLGGNEVEEEGSVWFESIEAVFVARRVLEEVMMGNEIMLLHTYSVLL